MNAQQLKNSILQQAIEGRLVPQDPNDEPASVLLERIRAEKKRLVKEGKLKKKDLEETPISEDEKPFEIPESWEWCKLGMITAVLGGKRIPAGRKLTQENTGHIYIRVSDMKEETVSTNNLLFVPEDIFPSISRYIINKEDVYITVAGTIGKIGKIPPELDGANLTENADRLVIRNINQDWLIKCLQSSVVQSQIADVTTKVGQPKLAILRIQNLLIPLPPLAEQQRIVAKIEELLPKVEEYGKAQEALDKLNSELPERLKKSILQEAITGHLVPQDPNDEPASVPLDKIRKEKARLVKEGKLKKKDLEETPINEDEIPYIIPNNWVWCRLKSICDDFIVPQRDKPTRFDGDIPWCRIEDIEGKYLNKSLSGQNISMNLIKEMNMHICPVGTVISACSASIGSQAIVTQACCTNQTFIGIVCKDQILHNEYLYYFLMSQKEQLKKKAKGTTIGYISRKKYEEYLFPLPPLAEQHRIVAKIEELMKEIDKLKA